VTISTARDAQFCVCGKHCTPRSELSPRLSEPVSKSLSIDMYSVMHTIAAIRLLLSPTGEERRRADGPRSATVGFPDCWDGADTDHYRARRMRALRPVAGVGSRRSLVSAAWTQENYPLHGTPARRRTQRLAPAPPRPEDPSRSR
jgi:hypothetical protein